MVRSQFCNGFCVEKVFEEKLEDGVIFMCSTSSNKVTLCVLHDIFLKSRLKILYLLFEKYINSDDK